MGVLHSGISGNREFPPTTPSVILHAGNPDSPEHARYLARLVELYWRPIYCVIRHAWAKRCTIRLARAGEVCRLTVADDGRGGMAGDGFGLAGMRERVASLGGTFLHDYSHGTTLTIELPLPPASLLAMEQRA